MMAPTTISEHVFIGINFLKSCPIRLPESFRRGCSSPAKIWMRGNLCGQWRTQTRSARLNQHNLEQMVRPKQPTNQYSGKSLISSPKLQSRVAISRELKLEPKSLPVRPDYCALLVGHYRINGACRLLLRRHLYRHWFRAQWRCTPLQASGARAPIPRDLVERVHSSGRRSR